MTLQEELQIATALAHANLHFLRRMGLLERFLTTTEWSRFGISEEMARMWWTRYEWQGRYCPVHPRNVCTRNCLGFQCRMRVVIPMPTPRRNS